MAETSKIEWTDATWNPITGCTPEQIEEGRRLFTNIALPLGTDMLLDWLSENFSALLTTAERAVVERDVLLLQLKHVEQAIYERDALRAEVERLRKALTEIAAFNDIWANGELFMCGSYSSFDEPHSVQTARAALATVAVSRDDDA